MFETSVSPRSERTLAAAQSDSSAPLVSLQEVEHFQMLAGARRSADSPPVTGTIDFNAFDAANPLYPTTERDQPAGRAELAPQPTINEAETRERLTREIARMPQALARDMTESMRVLESRTPPLSREQIAGVLDATERLLSDRNGTSPLDLGQRQLLAAGILDNAARPRDIDQGGHGTCNATVIEERLYTRNPEIAASLVAEVGLTGSFTARDGFRAVLDRSSLRPNSEARVLPSQGDGLRNYASQIFQVAVLNDFYQRQDPNIRYIQRDLRTAADPRGMAPTGEGLAASHNDRISQREARRASAFGGLDLNEINSLGRNLGLEQNYVIGHRRSRDANEKSGTTVVENVDQLAEALTRARATNNFPLVVGVEVDGPMFPRSSGRGGHVLSIVGYDPETRTVQISNQWGRAMDVSVPLQDLHDSMFRRPQVRRRQ
jgi:hypothetical protein